MFAAQSETDKKWSQRLLVRTVGLHICVKT